MTQVRSMMNMLPVLLLALAAMPVSGNDPPAAETVHLEFESRLADSPAVSVAYEGELVFRNSDITKTLSYAGAWATRPAGKASMRSDGEMHLVSGITVTPSDDPDAEPGFYDFPPNNLFIGPVSRRGFCGDVLYHFLREERGAEEERNGPIMALALSSEQVDAARALAGGMYFLLNPVDDFEFDPADNDDPAVHVLRYSVLQRGGESCPVRLWLDSETLVPLKREILIETGAASFTFHERYRAFSTDAIPEPFAENQRATRSLPVIVEQGRVAEQMDGNWIETDWLLEGIHLRALEPTRLRFLGEEATVTLAAGSEFVVRDVRRHNFGLPDGSDSLIPDGASALPEPTPDTPAPEQPREGFHLLAGNAAFEVPDRSWFTLLLGRHSFREPYESDEPVSVWTASPTRIVVERGGADDLRPGTEYALEEGRLEPQPRRTLPNLSNDVSD